MGDEVMNYHLCRNGQNAGIFPLEELHRRRLAGELSGGDLVWCEGMAVWQMLDSVLWLKGFSLPANSALPPRPGSGKSASQRALPWIVAAAALGLIAIIGIIVVVIEFAPPAHQQPIAVTPRRYFDPVEIAGRRIFGGTNSQTQADALRRVRNLLTREFSDAYRTNGHHDQVWDSDATQFLRAWIDDGYAGPTNHPPPRTLAGKLVAQRDCNDPLVLCAAGLLSRNMSEQRHLLERAVAAFPYSNYPAYPQLYATVQLASDLDSQSPRIAELDKQSLALFKKALTDGNLQPSDAPEIAENLVHGWGYLFFQRNGPALAQIARHATDFGWLGLVLQGNSEIEEAGKLRKARPGEPLSAKAWANYTNHLDKARTALTAAWERHQDRPIAASGMIFVAMSTSYRDPSEMRIWFDRVTVAQIDYPAAWTTISGGFRPRWHGSHEAMLALGISAVETKRFDTGVPRKFLDIVGDIESELQLETGEHIYGRDDVWPYMQEMYEGYINAPSQRSGRDGWRTGYAVAAYLAGKYDVAREQLVMLDWKPLPLDLTGWGTDLSDFSLRVAALTGNLGARVVRAERSASGMDFADAYKIYTSLTNSPDADDRTRQFGARRLAILDREQLLATGEETDFLPESDDDHTWGFPRAGARVVDSGAVEIHASERSHCLYSHARVGSEFEVTGEFEVLSSTNKSFETALMMGLPDNRHLTWYGFRMLQDAAGKQHIVLSHGWSRNGAWHSATFNDGPNKFRLHVQGGKVDAWINGAQVLDEVVFNDDFRLHSGSLLGFGTPAEASDATIRYRNVKVRRIFPQR